MKGDICDLAYWRRKNCLYKGHYCNYGYRKTTTSNNTREYLKICEERGMIETIGTDIPKSFIVTMQNGKQTVYLSPISSATLNKRIKKDTDDIRRNYII